MKRCLICAGIVTGALLTAGLAEAGPDHAERSRMERVKNQIASRGIMNPSVLEAMGNAQRHLFVPESQIGYAYEDRPLPIGHGQTISQPYIVALMTDLIRPEPGFKVLEIGAGSGYQAAVLAELVDHVYTVEIIAPLAEWAQERLRLASYSNVTVKHADGYYGWEEHAPFDAIVVTAATPHIPPPLMDQLKDGGRMIIPVGSPFRVDLCCRRSLPAGRCGRASCDAADPSLNFPRASA